MWAIGIDVGGSGIKAAVVDTRTGELLTERLRVDTPHPATPPAVVAATRDLITSFPADVPVGAGFPAPVLHGVTTTAAHVDQAWVGAPARELFSKALGRPVALLNDADAAGVAEARFGAAAGVDGVVVLLTLGTGIGSAVLHDGVLLPNTELGHLEIRGKDAEERAAASVRERRGLSWEEWAGRLSEVIAVVDGLLSPDLVLLGGGVSRRAGKFIPHIRARPPVRAAELENRAGVIGAALVAAGAVPG